MKWRIKEIFSPKYNRMLYVPQMKGLFFYSSFSYEEYRECIEQLYDMRDDFELVWEFPLNRVGFKTIKRAKDMIGYYKEQCKFDADYKEAERKAIEKGKKIKPKYIEVE